MNANKLGVRKVIGLRLTFWFHKPQRIPGISWVPGTHLEEMFLEVNTLAVYGPVFMWMSTQLYINTCQVTQCKESACYAGDAGDTGCVPGSGKSPGEGHGNPLQYSCLGNPMQRGAWWATVHGVTESRHDLTTEHQQKCNAHNTSKVWEALLVP